MGDQVRRRSRISMRSGWSFMRFDPITLSGESILTNFPIDFRTGTTILPSLPYPCTFAGP